jgi:hypothetical protein
MRGLWGQFFLGFIPTYKPHRSFPFFFLKGGAGVLPLGLAGRLPQSPTNGNPKNSGDENYFSLDTGWEEKYDVNGFILKGG